MLDTEDATEAEPAAADEDAVEADEDLDSEELIDAEDDAIEVPLDEIDEGDDDDEVED